MVRILRYDKKFITIYICSICIMVLYLTSYFTSTNKDETVFVYFFIMLVLALINLLFYVLHFFEKTLVFIIIKCLNLFVLGGCFYHNNLYILSFSALFYVLICLEIILIYSEKDQALRIWLILITFGPLIISSVLFFRASILHVNNILFIIQFLTALFGIYKIVEISSSEMRNKIEEQVHLWETSQNANLELQCAQNKIHAVNQQMAEQKFQLEGTNKELNRITAEMYIQNELLTYISSTLEIDALMDLVTDAIIGAVGVDTCSLIIHDFENMQFYFNSKSSFPMEQLIIDQLKDALESDQLSPYFLDKKAHMNSNVSLGDYPFISDRKVGSIIIMPLIRNSVIYGLMISEHASKGFFVESNLQFFQSIATQINIAVNNASLYTKMEEIATKDGLTGIYNRRHLQMNLNNVYSEIRATNGQLSVSLFDIDKFKAVNDNYGHLFGDEAIKMVARFANKYALKYGGFAGRYGGEEFVVVLPHISLQETIKIMEQMHSDLKKEPLYYNKDELVYINISIGITAYPDMNVDAEGLLNRADNAMYYSKKHGRGKITVDSIGLLDVHQ